MLKNIFGKTNSVFPLKNIHPIQSECYKVNKNFIITDVNIETSMKRLVALYG